MAIYDGVEITVKNDDEVFLGNDPAAIALIDVDKSVENYNTALRARLQAAFTGATITLEYGPYSGKSVCVSIDWDNVQEIREDEICAEVEEIAGQVYNLAAFWANI